MKMDLYCFSLSGKRKKIPPKLHKLKDNPVALLEEYSKIDISFKVSNKFDIELINDGLGGFKFQITDIDNPYIKDYAADEDITEWAKKWDLSNWGCFLVLDNRTIVGGAILARDTEGVNMLNARSDLVIIWDIRISPNQRNQGIGTILFDKIKQWSDEKSSPEIIVETQQINVEIAIDPQC